MSGRTTKEEREKRSKKAVRLFGEGVNQSEIARRLGCSQSTIGCDLDKAGVRSFRLYLPTATSLSERLAIGTGTKEPLTGCQEWLRGKIGQGRGYGYLSFKGEMFYAHRVALELKLGRKLVTGEVCRHRCHNPSCVNPDHLEPGTQADNVRDMIESGRQGNLTHNKDEKILRAKEMREAGLIYRLIGEKLGVSDVTARNWVRLKPSRPDPAALPAPAPELSSEHLPLPE